MKLSVKPVNELNRKIVEELEVESNQTQYIESVRDCLIEADNLEAWKPVCILDEDIVIGFAMYGLFYEGGCSRLWLDRFLIDKNHQGQGYAKPAISCILREMNKKYPNKDIYLSVYKENSIAISLYEYYGFEFNGEFDVNGEKVMVLKVK